MVRPEFSPIVRLSTRDIAPADRLNYANWILRVADGAAIRSCWASDLLVIPSGDASWRVASPGCRLSSSCTLRCPRRY